MTNRLDFVRPWMCGLGMWALALSTAACGAPDDHSAKSEALAACADRIDTSSPVLSNGFAQSLSNTRNNPSWINSSNVGRLALAFAHAADGSDSKRGTPAVTEQAIFLSAGRNIVAINRVSGCQYWSYTIPEWITPLVGSNAVRSSSIYFLNEGNGKPALVIAGDFYGNLYAVSASTGALVWSRFVGTEHNHHMITGSPQAYGGKLFVPVSSKEVLTTVLELTCCTSHGMLRALDPYTGNIFWTYHVTPNATVQLFSPFLGPNGGSIWSTPAIDPARGAVYIGTGQNLTHPVTSNTDSVVALDMATGRTRWVFKATADDAWNAACQAPFPLNLHCSPPGGDFDFGASPILAHLPNGRDAVIAGAKNGVVYSLDPATGALHWSRKIGEGANLGGIHWGMAVDGAHVYAGVTDVIVNKLNGGLTDLLSLTDAIAAAMQQTPNATPGVYALDLSTGNIAWQVHPTHLYGGVPVPSIYSAAPSVTNDVVFAGSLDGVMKAFRATDGAELWSYDTVETFTGINGVQGNGGTIDSVGAISAGGDLLVNSGYNQFGGVNQFQAGPGNALFVFRLPGAP